MLKKTGGILSGQNEEERPRWYSTRAAQWDGLCDWPPCSNERFEVESVETEMRSGLLEAGAETETVM